MVQVQSWQAYVGGASAVGEGERMPPASSATNAEDRTHAATNGGDIAATDDPGIESLHRASLTTANNAAADHEACVQPLAGGFGDRVTTLE